MLLQKQGEEWLCLNCQMQRALGASDPPGTPVLKMQVSPNRGQTTASGLKKDILQNDKPTNKNISTPITPTLDPKYQRPSNQTTKSSNEEKRDSLKQSGSGGFFGFGSRPPSADTKPTESMGGGMFGFGSTILSSASTLISSAVPDEPKTSTFLSTKTAESKGAKSPPTEKQNERNKLEQVTKQSPSLQMKTEKAASASQKCSPTVPKPLQSACPLCKVELNVGSKEPPNYNKCTECKKNVCNQCGFSPVPNVSEVNIATIFTHHRSSVF